VWVIPSIDTFLEPFYFHEVIRGLSFHPVLTPFELPCIEVSEPEVQGRLHRATQRERHHEIKTFLNAESGWFD